jgi:hypothetical protein
VVVLLLEPTPIDVRANGQKMRRMQQVVAFGLHPRRQLSVEVSLNPGVFWLVNPVDSLAGVAL